MGRFGFDYILIDRSFPEDHVSTRKPGTGMMGKYDVQIGVLTVPIEIAQCITDMMVDGGIKAVWNFTPFRIRVPEDIVVQNTSLYAHLAVMFNRLNFNEIK